MAALTIEINVFVFVCGWDEERMRAHLAVREADLTEEETNGDETEEDPDFEDILESGVDIGGVISWLADIGLFRMVGHDGWLDLSG